MLFVLFLALALVAGCAIAVAAHLSDLLDDERSLSAAFEAHNKKLLDRVRMAEAQRDAYRQELAREESEGELFWRLNRPVIRALRGKPS